MRTHYGCSYCVISECGPLKDRSFRGRLWKTAVPRESLTQVMNFYFKRSDWLKGHQPMSQKVKQNLIIIQDSENASVQHFSVVIQQQVSKQIKKIYKCKKNGNSTVCVQTLLLQSTVTLFILYCKSDKVTVPSKQDLHYTWDPLRASPFSRKHYILPLKRYLTSPWQKSLSSRSQQTGVGSVCSWLKPRLQIT